MPKLYIIHALDETTSFLSVFQKHFPENYCIIKPCNGSVADSIDYLHKIPDNAIVVFLGHGQSMGLYTPESKDFTKTIFIDHEIGSQVFSSKDVLLLSCKSNQFIKQIKSSRTIIGFGDILSSMNEVKIEADIEGDFRDLSESDIDYYNMSYCFAIINSLEYHKKKKSKFEEIPVLIEFFINKKINETLLNKEIKNRIEIARLLFEFKNEMLTINNN